MAQIIALNFDDMELLSDTIFDNEYEAECAIIEYCVDGQWPYDCTRYNIEYVSVHESDCATLLPQMAYCCVGTDYDGAPIDYETPSQDPIGHGSTPIEAVKAWLDDVSNRDIDLRG